MSFPFYVLREFEMNSCLKKKGLEKTDVIIVLNLLAKIKCGVMFVLTTLIYKSSPNCQTYNSSKVPQLSGAFFYAMIPPTIC